MSAVFCSPVEAGSRLTSPYGKRWGTLHAGTDYGTPVAGTKGRPAFAVADGTVIRTGRGNGKADAEVVPYHSGFAVWLDLGWIGGDHMRAYYGHLDEILVKPGQRVRAGEVIGIIGGSGARTMTDFALHLHFGVAQNDDRPNRAARAFGDPGWINPHVWLQGKKITPGVTPVPEIVVLAGAVTKPAPAPMVHVRSEASIRAICIKAGHGTSKTSTGLLIERYQHRQRAPFQLPHDRHWGKRTEQHYLWTIRLQRAMNQWKGTKLAVDGDHGARTVARVRELQQRNGRRGGAYWNAGGRVADGIAGPIFCKMLGIPAHP